MGQYQQWLLYREIEQHLREQQIAYIKEVAEIDEHIARIENTAMQKDNALLTALMQQLKLQEYTTSKTTDTTGAQREYNGVRPESADSQKYLTPPSPNSGQQDRDRPQPLHASPPLVAWNQLPHQDAQEMPLSDKHIMPAETASVLPESASPQWISDLNTPFYQELQKDAQIPLPWWLRNLMQSPLEEEEPPQTAPTHQQSIQTKPPVERWFARRTRLIHYKEKPPS